MLKKISSIRPTIFAGVLISAGLFLAACSPVAIMMPQPEDIDQDAKTVESAPGYYVRAPGYMAEEPVTGEIDVAATPYLRSARAAAESSSALEPVPGEVLLKIAADPGLGDILVDGSGFTLYMFTKDEPDKSNCAGGCLDAWPPLLAVDNPAVGEGVDASLLGSAALPDGSLIVTYNHMPLYFWQDDMQPGDTKGQGVNDVWFVVSPGGEPIGME